MALRVYDTPRWRKLRVAFLRDNPLCAFCHRQGRVKAASLVDHKVTVRMRPDLAFDMNNLQALCASCHSAAKQSEDRTGRIRGCDIDGVPLDPRHLWREGSA